uniref:Uncharacterized protein n=1 Tax=uncultured bacterium contig00053 TaxID=1181537 RepID=A0A806JY64_9BACT|nr:hypothetical protein [uncultured bacterium contig00053]
MEKDIIYTFDNKLQKLIDSLKKVTDTFAFPLFYVKCTPNLIYKAVEKALKSIIL